MTRAVLITGASSGIGRATALALAERGAVLVLVARRRPELEELASVCKERGASGVLVAPADVSDVVAWEDSFERAVAEFGRVDVVVHAAAVAAYGRFTEIPGEVFDRVQKVNVNGTANVARTALRQFEAQREGHLVVFGSLVGKISTPYLSPYVTSKWAVHGLARTLQAELPAIRWISAWSSQEVSPPRSTTRRPATSACRASPRRRSMTPRPSPRQWSA